MGDGEYGNKRDGMSSRTNRETKRLAVSLSNFYLMFGSNYEPL